MEWKINGSIIMCNLLDLTDSDVDYVKTNFNVKDVYYVNCGKFNSDIKSFNAALIIDYYFKNFVPKFDIVDIEGIDDGKHYFIISAVKGETELTSEHLQNIYDEFSKLLINRNDVILRSYLEMLLENNTGYLEKIEGEKRAGLESRNLLIEEVISLMDSSERR